MTMRVVCTAGHVDHGKSTLVRALTGMEPDRFEEERRRGLTIDIGFAWTELPTSDLPVTVAFVDLPGHERFVGNMLAGAGPVELALFVVAADEGWMPQSEEHLAILDLLGISRGIVALTKADTVEPALLEQRCDEVREHLSSTALHTTDIVPVSAVSGEGLDVLRSRLADALAAAPAPRDSGRPRLWVDRAFSIRGAGTVVTGTLGAGHIGVGDEVWVLPGERRGRVRALQSLKADLEVAQPGARVAVNLAGIDRDEVHRGDALTAAGAYLGVSELDAWVRALPGLRIGRRGAWHVHVGSRESLAQVTPLADDVSVDGGCVRVTLATPAPLVAGDRFILREAGRRATLGGGVVLDVDPVPLRGRAARATRVAQLAERLEALRAESPARLLALHTAERGGADLARAAAAVGLPPGDVDAAVRAAGLLRLAHAVASPAAAAAWGVAVTDALRRHHADHPVERAARKDVAVRAARAAGCPSDLADALLDVLVRLGRIAGEGTGVRLPDHRVALDDTMLRARRALLDALDADPFSPPRLSEAVAAAGAATPLLREMEAAGELVRLGPDLAMTRAAVDAAADRLRATYAATGPFTAAAAKQALETTRKYAVPLLEHLDAAHVTRRSGDVRDIVG